METKTCFNLTAAIESWRNELAVQPDLAADERRELEAHLRDLISEFNRKGLREAESFKLACERVGQLRQVGSKFQKNHSFKTKRHPVMPGAWFGFIAGLAMFLIGLSLAQYTVASWGSQGPQFRDTILNMP